MTGAGAPGYSAACSLSIPVPGLYIAGLQVRDLLPHRWLQSRDTGSCAGRAGTAFRDDIGVYAQGAVVQESVFAGASRQSRTELVVLTRDAQALPLMPDEQT